MDVGSSARGRRRALEALVRRQHGVVTRSQLLAHGVGRGAIESRRRAGRLTLLHRGVYRVGPVELALARHMAAALACGDGAVVSHDDAGRIHRLPSHGAAPGPIHVSIPSTSHSVARASTSAASTCHARN